MIFLLVHWLIGTGLIVFFGICGSAVVQPLQGKLRFPMLAAPLAGIMVIPLGANALYSILGLSYQLSLFISASCVFAVAVYQMRGVAVRDGIVQLVFASMVISLLALILIDARSLLNGSPAIFLKWGSDHAGYAHQADWLLDQNISQRPWDPNPNSPYESWPEFMFGNDPRFGSIGYLAFIAFVTKTSSLFAYPFATVVGVSCSVLSVAAIYAKSLKVLVFGCAALLISCWVDYAYIGFFGRTLGLPAALYLAGLTMRLGEDPRAGENSSLQLVAFVLIGAAAGTVYPGFVVGAIVASVVAPYAVLKLWRLGRPALPEVALKVTLGIVVPVVASGVLSRPLGFKFPQEDMTWATLLGKVLEIENIDVPISGLSTLTSGWLAVISLVVAGLLSTLAFRKGAYDAFCLLVGSTLLLGLVLLMGKTSVLVQMSGVFYPCYVCGSIALMGDKRSGSFFPSLALAAQAALRVPRIIAAVHLFGYAADPNFVFTFDEIDRLRAAIGSKTAKVDIGSRYTDHALILLVELGRSMPMLQWSPESWHSILGYRKYWRYQEPHAKPDFVIKLRDASDPHRHFDLEAVDHSTSRP